MIIIRCKWGHGEVGIVFIQLTTIIKTEEIPNIGAIPKETKVSCQDEINPRMIDDMVVQKYWIVKDTFPPIPNWMISMSLF